MTLLTALREHKTVATAAKTLEASVQEVDIFGGAPAWESFFRDKDAYDRALVTACLQEAAKRTRETAQSYISDGHPDIACEWLNAADFLDQMAKESAE